MTLSQCGACASALGLSSFSFEDPPAICSMGDLQSTQIPCNETVEWDTGTIWTAHSHFVSKEYYFNTTLTNFQTQEAFCVASGGEVATINTIAEKQALRSA